MFLIDDLGIWNQGMELVCCKRLGIVIQGPTPYHNCKLNIASIFTVLDLLDYHHCVVIANDGKMGRLGVVNLC